MITSGLSTTKPAAIRLGMNSRLFANNWRPIAEEIAFAERTGFQVLQIAVREEGITAAKLGDSLEATADLLACAGLTIVIEIVVALGNAGKNPADKRPLEILQANVPAFHTLSVYAAHWHFVPQQSMTMAEITQLEKALLPELRIGVEIAGEYGVKLGIEHNEPDFRLFGTAAQCAAALEATPGLHFVWDLNHTTTAALDEFLALTPRMSMLHVSDTPLPAVNYHLPIGMGSIDFAQYFHELNVRGFAGPAILEIGGQPKSGGFGRDSDDALISSFQQLQGI